MATLEQFEQMQERARWRGNRQEAKDRRKKELTTERFQRFETLEARNQAISERADEMLWALTAYEPHKCENGLWVVLKHVADDEGDCIVGSLERIDNGQEEFGHFDFSVFGTDEAGVKYVMDKPYSGSISSVQFNTVGSVEESTYTIQESRGEYDEISRLVGQRSPGRQISPISALQRHLLHREITEHINGLSDTIHMFETAVANPDLNPHFAEAARASDIPHIGDMVA